MTRSSKIFYGLATSYIHFVVLFIANLALVPILLHYLGNVQYGIWVTIASIVGYVGILDFGSTFSVSKFISEYYAKKQIADINKMASTALLACLSLSSFALVIVVVLSYFIAGFLNLSGELAGMTTFIFLMVGLNLALSFPSNAYGGILYGAQKIHAYNIISIIGVLINFVLLIGGLKLGFGLSGVAIVLLISSISVAVMRVVYVNKISPHILITPRLFDRKFFGQLFSFSFYMFVLSVGAQVVFNTDNIIIAKVLGVGMVAAYAVAMKINQVAMAFIFKLADVFFPFFSELHAVNDKDKLAEYFYESTRFSAAIAAPLFIIFILWGGDIISFWVGKEYFVGWPVIYLLAVVTLVNSLIHASAVALQGMGKIKSLVGFNLLEAAVNLLLSLLLAYKLGILGVALGTVMAMLLSNAWYVPYLACKEIGVSLRVFISKSVAKPLLIGIVILGGLYSLDLYINNATPLILALKVLVLIVIYCMAFIRFGLDAERRTFYMDKFRKIAGYVS